MFEVDFFWPQASHFTTSMENCTATPPFNSAQSEQHVAVSADFSSPSLTFEASGLPNSAVVDGNLEPTGSEVGQKRKRGRPRKYDANLTSPKSTSPPSKRGRGRPRGSGNLQQLASIGGMCSLTAAGSLVPHVVDVKAGENLVEIVKSFSSKGHRSLSIQSAIGPLSLVEMYNPFDSQLLTYNKGPFDIISLSGSYTNGSDRDQSLQMRILLAKSDGVTFVGRVGGRLIAAGPIRVILSSFKEKLFTGSSKKRLSPGSSGAANAPDDSDSSRLSLQVPRMIEPEQSFPSPTSGLIPMTSNGFPDHATPRTSNGLLNNVTAATTNGNGIPNFFSLSQSMHSTYMNSSNLDRQLILQPFTNPMTFGDL